MTRVGVAPEIQQKRRRVAQGIPAHGSGVPQGPGSYFGDSALRVHRTPLEWLRAERDGVVIVQPQLTYAYLRDARRLSFADPAHAQQVNRWLEPPRPRTELFLEVPDERAA